jgi:ribonuclease VapC
LKYVADSSAVLAFLQDEPVSIDLVSALAESTISAVNLCEVATKLIDAGRTIDEAQSLIDELDLPAVPLSSTLALEAAALRDATRHIGLSLGDRCCLSLAQSLDLPALTGDRGWADVMKDVGIGVVLIR